MRALDQDPVALARVPAHPIPRGRPALHQLRAGRFGQHARALTIQHAYGIENLRGAAADTAVRLLRKLTELSHLAEDSQQAAAAWALGHRLERGEHGFGARVVCVVDDRVARGGLELLEAMLDDDLLQRLCAFF